MRGRVRVRVRVRVRNIFEKQVRVRVRGGCLGLVSVRVTPPSPPDRAPSTMRHSVCAATTCQWRLGLDRG